jgi:hypothetical protein
MGRRHQLVLLLQQFDDEQDVADSEDVPAVGPDLESVRNALRSVASGAIILLAPYQSNQ